MSCRHSLSCSWSRQFVDKLKDWFSDEEEVPIKTEKTHVEISLPKDEEKEEIADREVLKSAEKVTPVFFSDEDFKEIPEKESIRKKSLLKSQKEENLKFKPSPIISPVYGILDKNYQKEDITNKKKSVGAGSYNYENTRDYDIDLIRKKAYGTLDDDLEQELSSQKHVLVNEEFVEEKDLFDELEEKQENEIEIEEDNQVSSKEEILEVADVKESFDDESLEAELFPVNGDEDKMMDEEENEEVNEDTQDLRNENLFDLIDTMYEKGD